MLRSLRVRLLLGAAVAILLALATAWVPMTMVFQKHIEHRVATDLIRDGVLLAANLEIGADGAVTLSAEPGDARYQQPASGMYWQVTTASTLPSRSLWDQTLPPAPAAQAEKWSTRFLDGPFGKGLMLVERRVRLEHGGGDVLIQLGYEIRPLIVARREFGQQLAKFLGILWLVLLAAAWTQVALGLRPLQRIREEVESLKSHPGARLNAARAQEIEPLTRAINELADAREKDLARARRRAADLAHGLKTPLAALSAQSRRARAAGATEAADGLDRAIAAAAAAIEAELHRSRAATIRAERTDVATPLLPLAESIVGVVERTEFGSAIVYDVDIAPQATMPVAAEDLLELLGALIENAARHARRRVLVGARNGDGLAELFIEDDGPGIEAEKAAEAILRGSRLDEAGDGHGLGLAIAHDLAEATRGKLALSRAGLGGLRVSACWQV